MKFEQILVMATALVGLMCLVDAVFLRKRRYAAAGAADEIKDPIIVEYSRSFFPILLLVLVLRSFGAEPFRIPSGSMKPTLLEGDFIVVNKFAYGLRLPILGTKLYSIGSPQRGDVVVFRHEGNQDLIKRVVGLPGDHIQYKDRQLYINGKLVPTKFVSLDYDGHIPVDSFEEDLNSHAHAIFIDDGAAEMAYAFHDVVVPQDSYFVLGDNRSNSKDSRYWGFLKDRDLLGSAAFTWLSWDSEHKDIRWSRFGKWIR